MSTINDLIPRQARLFVYLVALGGLLLLGALAAGFAAIDVAAPTWFRFVAAAWAFSTGPAGLGVATASNLADRRRSTR